MSIFGKKKDLIGEALVSIEPPKFDLPEVIKKSKLKPTKCKHCHSIYQAQHKHIIRELDYATLNRVDTMTICPVCGCKNDVEFEGGRGMKETELKQIEEMAKDLCDIDCKGMKCNTCDSYGCEYRMQAEALYNAGYRKQSEGEWLPSDIPQEKYVCSVCGGACWYYDFQGDVAKSRYCPNCGAKMKGGAE